MGKAQINESKTMQDVKYSAKIFKIFPGLGSIVSCLEIIVEDIC